MRQTVYGKQHQAHGAASRISSLLSISLAWRLGLSLLILKSWSHDPAWLVFGKKTATGRKNHHPTFIQEKSEALKASATRPDDSGEVNLQL